MTGEPAELYVWCVFLPGLDRMWALGDRGSGDFPAEAVRNAPRAANSGAQAAPHVFAGAGRLSGNPAGTETALRAPWRVRPAAPKKGPGPAHPDAPWAP
jgi:hypothetical protein